MADTKSFTVGRRVTYLPVGKQGETLRLCRRGVVAGDSLLDVRTGDTWVPVRDEGKAADEPEWVRADRIIDVAAGP